MTMMKKEEGHNHWWKRRCKQERLPQSMRNPQKKLSKETEKRQFSLGSYDRELGLQIFLFRGFEKPKHHRIFSPRERERWRRQLLRRWGQFFVEICASEMADQNTGLEKLWFTTKLALPAFVSCPDFSSRKSKPGIWKGWWIRTRVDLFFVFFLRNSGGKNKKKSAKFAIFTEFVLGDRQKKKNKGGFYEISIFPFRL